jgi:hypothetical protein
MRRRLFLCFLPWQLIALFACAATAQTKTPAPRNDTQIWTDVQLAMPLNKNIDFLLLGTLRLGRNVTRLVDERIGAGFAFKIGKYLTLSPSYLYLATQPLPGKEGFENRLSFAATLRFPLGRFTVSDRNLFERRLRHPQVDATRYRNRLQVEHPIKVGSTKLNVFVSDEVFYDWSANAWVRNRFAAGVSKRFSKHFTADVYYLRQNDSHTTPGDLNVVGDTLRFRL